MFGDVAIESVIAAGAEAAARGTLLTCNQVLLIFNWYMALEERNRKTSTPRICQASWISSSIRRRDQFLLRLGQIPHDGAFI